MAIPSAGSSADRVKQTSAEHTVADSTGPRTDPPHPSIARASPAAGIPESLRGGRGERAVLHSTRGPEPPGASERAGAWEPKSPNHDSQGVAAEPAASAVPYSSSFGVSGVIEAGILGKAAKLGWGGESRGLAGFWDVERGYQMYEGFWSQSPGTRVQSVCLQKSTGLGAVSHSISGSFPILQQCPDSLTALAALEFTFTKILCLYQEGRLPKEVVTSKQLLPEKELLQLDA
ncbi:hypothetical protein ACRRTK_004410 [Alexandromys fortis]